MSTSTYLFILGRKPLLSLAEIISIWGEKSIKAFEDEMAILELSDEDPLVADLHKTLERIGGTMKIAKIVQVFDRDPVFEDLIEKSYDGVHSRIMGLKKVLLGVSMYNVSERHNQLPTNFLKVFKKYLTELGYTGRYLNKSNANLASAAALDEDIIHKGVEFNFAQIEGKFYVAATVAAQDFRIYAKRDYNKPYRDNQAGMLPPKLAQVMINIGRGLQKEVQPEVVTPLLYDPFCGSGSMLMESMLCGFNAIGSDIRLETVEGAHVNCEWIQKEFPDSSHNTYEIFEQDVTAMNPAEITQKYHPTMIVSESYLGPYFKKRPTRDEIQKVQENLGDLYKKAMEKFAALQVPVVFAIAAHKHGTEHIFNEAIEQGISEGHLKRAPIIPNWILKRFSPEEALVKGYAIDRQTLVYDRDDQMVAREIFMLVPGK
ncbi:MAG: hypothetical protein WC101_01650 [Candidatus Gracilibacteria bacterium]